MSKLKELRGVEVYPKVSDIVESATAVKTAQGYGEITTPNGKYYYILSIEDEISDNPENFTVRKSSKHGGILFIVESRGSGFNLSAFNN